MFEVVITTRGFSSSSGNGMSLVARGLTIDVLRQQGAVKSSQFLFSLYLSLLRRSKACTRMQRMAAWLEKMMLPVLR